MFAFCSPEKDGYVRLQIRTERERKMLAAALRNMATAVDNCKGENEELIVSAAIVAGQAWSTDPNIWTVFEGWVWFSAGPNAVASQHWPPEWPRYAE